MVQTLVKLTVRGLFSFKHSSAQLRFAQEERSDSSSVRLEKRQCLVYEWRRHCFGFSSRGLGHLNMHPYLLPTAIPSSKLGLVNNDSADNGAISDHRCKISVA